MLERWTHGSFTADGCTYPTYRRGTGPGVIVMAEIPGITPSVIAFADRVVAAGMTVVMPSLFGTPGKGAFGRVHSRRSCEALRVERVHRSGAQQDAAHRSMAACLGGQPS